MGKPARPPALKLTGKARTVLSEKGLPETSAGLERLGELTALDAVRHLHSMGSPLNTKALEQASKRVAAKTGLP
ncbi:MAG TPA: hypothetical protein VJI67_01420, partial [archaeon]|nr:hypothetical protein [archaeon]